MSTNTLTLESLQQICIIPKDKAVLCRDCQAISNGKLHCPACGSSSLDNIVHWLERDTQSDNQENSNYELSEDHTNHV